MIVGATTAGGGEAIGSGEGRGWAGTVGVGVATGRDGLDGVLPEGVRIGSEVVASDAIGRPGLVGGSASDGIPIANPLMSKIAAE